MKATKEIKKVPIRSGLATIGEITIMGKVLPVGSIQRKIRAAYDAGVREVFLNLERSRGTPLACSRRYQANSGKYN